MEEEALSMIMPLKLMFFFLILTFQSKDLKLKLECLYVAKT